jgi:lipopolysaccharide/colanic/teichoic acid biosynthesis glycosyltransferase
MPDDQFASDVKPLGVAFSTITRDALIAPPAPRTVAREPIPVQHREPLIAHQQRLIQNAFQEIELESQTESSRPSWIYQASKRALDLSIAIPALILFAPLMLLIALAIRYETPGPAIFKQQRVGKHGRLFRMYKFRSMTDNAGVILSGLHKSREDSRITQVGRFIRKTSLDELPQLVNVILGQMSLVGPRPELPEIVLLRYEPWQYRRLAVQQGITGWWQVTGRGKKLLWKHTDDDLYYVDRASLWFDIKLLLMTIAAVLRRDGAF